MAGTGCDSDIDALRVPRVIRRDELDLADVWRRGRLPSGTEEGCGATEATTILR